MGSEGFRRRTFLTAGAAAAAGASGLLLEGCDDDDASGADSSSAKVETVVGDDWEQVRSSFALDPNLAHFAAFVLAGHPAPVRDAIARWREQLDTDPDAALHEGARHDDEVRRAAADYLGVRAEEIVLTDSTTMGLGLTHHGLRLQPGDHILTSTHDFYSTHESLRLAAARSGARVEQVPLYDDPASASTDQIVSRVRDAIRPETRLVALTWVHSSTGVKLPARAIADAVAETSAGRDPDERVVFSLDAVHGFGAQADGPTELGVDVFISGTHKWLFGPRGTGLVWLRPDTGRAVAPIIPAFDATSIGNWMFDQHATGPYSQQLTPGGYQAFEHRWAAADAFAFHGGIGRDRVADRTTELATRLKDGLAEQSNVRLVTPRDPGLSAGIVCCEIAGIAPGEAILALREGYDIVASVTPYRESYVRFGPSIATSPDQVDNLVQAVASL